MIAAQHCSHTRLAASVDDQSVVNFPHLFEEADILASPMIKEKMSPMSEAAVHATVHETVREMVSRYLVSLPSGPG